MRSALVLQTHILEKNDQVITIINGKSYVLPVILDPTLIDGIYACLMRKIFFRKKRFYLL